MSSDKAKVHPLFAVPDAAAAPDETPAQAAAARPLAAEPAVCQFCYGSGMEVVAGKGGGFLAAILPHGMRAIAIDVSPESGAGGFILPNAHVDVVLTRRDKAAEKIGGVEKWIIETILKNVRVLAVDQAVEEKEGQKVVVGKTATIELDPQQVETLALSRQVGTISLTLRSIRDSQTSAEGVGDTSRDERGAISTVRFGVSTLGNGR